MQDGNKIVLTRGGGDHRAWRCYRSGVGPVGRPAEADAHSTASPDCSDAVRHEKKWDDEERLHAEKFPEVEAESNLKKKVSVKVRARTTATAAAVTRNKLEGVDVPMSTVECVAGGENFEV